MVRFAANLSLMFNELDFLDRFEAAAQAGFDSVEFQFPYDFEAEAIADKLQSNSLQAVLHNMPAGDLAAGERGLTILPERKEEYRDGVAKAIRYANTLGVRQLQSLMGIMPDGADPAELRQTYIANLQFATEQTSKAGIKTLVEPKNTRDMPGYYLNTSAQAEAILNEVGSDNLHLLYDIYHMQIMEGDLAPTMERLLPRIAHMQLADTPGRHEPGTGEINYPFLFTHLERIGYDGWVGCEYLPATTTLEGLSWLRDLS